MPSIRTSDLAVSWRGALRTIESRAETLFGRIAVSPWAMPVAVLVAIAAFSTVFAGFNLLNRSFDDVSNARAITSKSRQLRLALVDAETGQRGFALTGDVLYLEPHTLAVARLPEIRKNLARLAATDAEGRRLYTEVEKNLDRAIMHWQVPVELVRQGDPLRAQAVIQGGRGKAIMDELRGDMEKLERLYEFRLVRFEDLWRLSLTAVGIAVTCVIMLILALFLLLLRYSVRAIETERRHSAYAQGERERLERAVSERTIELSELAGYLQQVQERERFNVARELHDEMGALLTASKMNVSWLLRQGQGLPAPVRDKLQKLDGLLEQGVQLKRRVIEGLAPSALSNLGLTSALEALVDQVGSSAGIRASFSSTGNPPDLPHDVGIAFYRVAQEALTNVQKHAKAAEARVELEFSARWTELRVHDNGQGISEIGPGKTMVHGLRGMRHRAESLGGSFAVHSAPRQGTTITFRVPTALPAPA